MIARYQGIAGYDWVAMPLVPYLYSLESTTNVPSRVGRETVRRLRDRYREQHLGMLGANLFAGNPVRGRYSLLPQHTAALAPDRLYRLTWPEEVGENPDGAGVQPGAALSGERTGATDFSRWGDSPFPPAVETSPGLKEIVSPNE